MAVEQIRRGWLDNMHFHLEDILTGRTAANPNKAVVNVLDIKEPIIALFDNGDKRRETDIYARYLAVGSVLLLHDWEHLDLPKPHWEMTYSYVKKELEAVRFVVVCGFPVVSLCVSPKSHSCTLVSLRCFSPARIRQSLF